MNDHLYAPLRQWPADDIGASQRDPAAWPNGYGQGRFDQRPGLHLVDSSDHGAAHCCTEIDSDSDRDDDKPGQGAGVFLVPVCVALSCVACWALYAWLSAVPQ